VKMEYWGNQRHDQGMEITYQERGSTFMSPTSRLMDEQRDGHKTHTHTPTNRKWKASGSDIRSSEGYRATDRVTKINEKGLERLEPFII
jgi:hypothetical protein